MSFSARTILNAMVSHAESLGVFDVVNSHEPKNAPGNGTACAIWVQSLMPYAIRSGLDATTVRAVFTVRIYMNMIQEPQDEIDINILDATDKLMEAYTGDFTLGGAVRNIDLLGAGGPGLSANAGYIEIDKRIYRAMTITVPVVVNDVWDQEA